ncbi:MAG: hypothetical protein GY798_24645 [Hyphomicrobiales bacterium]|nr:hypothetical protein [Hyphomicrobiales bacterium]
MRESSQTEFSPQPDTNGDGFNRFLMDRVDAVWWGLAFIWGALILLTENAGWADAWHWWDGWGVFWTGAGVLALLAAVIRLQVPAYRAKWGFSTVFGIIFLAIGLATWQAAWWAWVVVLFVIGAVSLLSAFSRPG